MLEQFTNWLAQSYLTTVFSDTTRLETWLIIPVSQSLHILGIAMVMICVSMLNLKLLGFAVTRQSFAQLSTQLMPWIWGALIVLFITGVVQTIAEPTREIMNLTFRIKMAMLIVTIVITALYRVQVNKDAGYWNRSPGSRKAARLLATFSLALWVGILVAGRLIAYMGAMQEF